MRSNPPDDVNVMPPRPLLAFYGHHKCASTWVHSVLDYVCADAGWRLSYLTGPKDFGNDLAAHVERERVDLISYVNADLEDTLSLPPHRGFHLVRDPRDVIVSGYFSHRGTHPTHAWPELLPHREKLQQFSKEDGLLLEVGFSGQFLRKMKSWDYDQPHVLELQQEQFTLDPYRAFLDIFQHLGVLDESHYNKVRWPKYLLQATLNILHRRASVIPRFPMSSVPGERLLGIVYDQRFEKFTRGRKRGEEDTKSHYRKGEGGDWVNHFTEEHVAAFKEHYGDLAERLGYEDDADWSVASARDAQLAGR